MTEELKRLYASNVMTERAYDTLELYHPFFDKRFYFVQDTEAHDWKIEDGSIVTFLPFAFKLVQPSKGSDQQDIQLVMDNVWRLVSWELEKAFQAPEIPIEVVYRVYRDGSDENQITPVQLELSNINVDGSVVSGMASRRNLFNKKIPRRVYEPWVFKGLV